MYHAFGGDRPTEPNFQGLLKWGVTVFEKKLDAGKLDRHVVEGHFVGNDEESKGYSLNVTRTLTRTRSLDKSFRNWTKPFRACK